MRKQIFVSLALLTLLLLLPKKIHAQEKAAGSSALLAQAEITPTNDVRAKVLREFLLTYNSPLAQSAETFVSTADKYGLDWKLVAAISGVESTFAHQLPYNSYNAWGWGIYGDNMIRFSSYDEAIETISKGLSERYIKQWGAKDVYAIGRYYAASPTWAERVTHFMDKITVFEQNYSAQTLSLSI
ncbi:MAG: glucosaminidase domain-containing protein [Candidatus Levybacteria bacterium]|nr:glucosaminidase domain-containing protein [Candidatus Levybacteria bacterium]